MVIWKYNITIDTTFEIEAPKGHFEVLDVQMQNTRPVFWAVVDPTQEKIKRKFRIVPTGEAFTRHQLMYRGTFQYGFLVFHLFEMPL